MAVETEFHLDGNAKTITVNRVQDVEDIIERNKALQTMEQRSDWGRHIGEIPNVFIEQWLNEEYQRGNVGMKMSSPEFKALIKRKLRDPQYAFLRVTDKRF